MVDRLRQLWEELGVGGIVLKPNPGGPIPVERVMRSRRTLAHEVVPALR